MNCYLGQSAALFTIFIIPSSVYFCNYDYSFTDILFSGTMN